jgi:hypothetical protein
MACMHPEMSFQIAKLRHEELTSRRHLVDQPVRSRGIRRFFRRHRDMATLDAVQPPSLVLLPPPREERDPKGRDQRVA